MYILDFPSVDWVIQYDCPEDATTYLHRVGRTARNAAVGQSLLVLLPSEEPGMSQQLRAHKIPVDKIEYAKIDLQFFKVNSSFLCHYFVL